MSGDAACPLFAGQSVTIGIHPEHIRTAEGLGPNTIRGSLDRAVDAITSVNCRFRLDGHLGETPTLDAVLFNSDARSLTDGQQCYLHLPAEHLAIIADR